MLDSLKIALVCDWLTVYAGAERVVHAIHELFPNAIIHTTLFDPEKCSVFKNAKVKTSFLQKIPFANKMHRVLFPFMPIAFENFDLDEYDIVISSSHAAAKGVITKPETMHISYCHSPTRYLWDHSHEYQREFKKFSALKFIYKPILHNLRMWDRVASDRVDFYIANSAFVANRIKKYYKRKSTVLHPPIDLSFFEHQGDKSDYYLAVGRLIPYKKFDIIIEACNELSRKLKIIGTGPETDRLKKMASASDNIEFLGHASAEDLKKHYQNAKALIFPQVEDFGIVPLEAMACGTPVIAYAKGGALETVKPYESGVFFFEQNAESLKNAILDFEKLSFDSLAIAKSVQDFSQAKFKSHLRHLIFDAWNEHKKMLS